MMQRYLHPQIENQQHKRKYVLKDRQGNDKVNVSQTPKVRYSQAKHRKLVSNLAKQKTCTSGSKPSHSLGIDLNYSNIKNQGLFIPNQEELNSIKQKRSALNYIDKKYDVRTRQS